MYSSNLWWSLDQLKYQLFYENVYTLLDEIIIHSIPKTQFFLCVIKKKLKNALKIKPHWEPSLPLI